MTQMRRPIVAGNRKCHKTAKEAVELITQLCAVLDGRQAVDVVVCPPYTALAAVHEPLRGSPIALGAQDVFWESEGAFTGEVSAPMLVDAECRYVIIGHSERRQRFGETDESVRSKLIAALQHALVPIVCVGETLQQRQAQQTVEVVRRQLDGALRELTAGQLAGCVIAYEPVWAIGTGRNATPEQAQEMHASIREHLRARWSADAAQAVRIQYGGSVTAANAAELLQQPDLDGALVGGASLSADSFAAIVKAAGQQKSATAAARG